jgi:hypothetical protein
MEEAAVKTLLGSVYGLDRLTALNELRGQLDDELLATVHECRVARCTWDQIGQALYISKQAARKRFIHLD